MRKFLFIALALTAGLPTAMAGPSGRMLGDTCAGCHGTGGVSAGLAMPSLAGMPADFIALAMREFRDGRRGSSIMGRIARGYGDAEIEAMAAYFGAQAWVSAPQTADPQLAARGARLHKRKCEACHREAGRSTEQDMPRMAGQWRDYLRLSLDGTREANRPFHPSPDMKVLMEKLSADDVTALAHFYASQN